ncbi:hypothetical protein JTE90_005985 [Oedothorax gibbosus]|uniref:CBS domain-containing protein n=1 Tax=Oedothorax gibbosus TaxID=931172 RepID=A0AAV6UW20_9ARAC|nr:hypothetical protein JTE90_005985 [Oedothorax gibbosus]
MKTVVGDDAKTVELLAAKESEAVKSPAEDSTETVAALVSEVSITLVTKDEHSTQIEMKSLSPESDLQLKTDDEKAKKLKLLEDKSTSIEKPSDASLAVETLDAISVLSLHGSSESEITPPPTCFNWFKKYSSPQRLMSKLMHKREYKIPKSQKSDLPSLDSAVSDPKDSPPEILLEGGAKYYENIFIGAAIFIPPQNEIERIDYATLAEEKIIPAYLGAHPCYDVMPTSGKVIILSVELLVKNAFSALVSNDIKAAPLWDAGYFDFVGMLTISDFINVLRHYYYSSPEDIKDIENQSISTWRRITKVEKPFVKVNGSDSLVQATKLLIQEGVHRIPVFDEKRQSVLFVLTRKRLLHFLSNSLFENFEKTNVKTPSFFRKTIRELKVGTFEDIATVEVSTKVIDALDLFVKRGVSSLPVVEKDNVLIDIFEKFDVFQLAKEQTYHNLDMPIKEAISKADVRETAWICTLDETFGTVINRFVNNKVHRIVVTNEKRAVVGLISLSDVLKFLVLNPLENSGLPSTAETIEEDSEGAVGGTSSEPSPSLETTAKADSIDEESTVSEAVENLKIEDSKAE